MTLSRAFGAMLGGELPVDSTPGRGSTFAVALPANFGVVRTSNEAPVEVAAAPDRNAASVDQDADWLRPLRRASHLPSSAPDAPASGCEPEDDEIKILLVKDHEEIWDFLSRRLKRHGFEVAVATHGQGGVDESKSEEPDIILLDMNLPALDGWSAAGLIRAYPAMAAVPIIAPTAHAVSGRQGSGRRGGLHRLLFQPVDFSGLLAKAM